jgi:hypothetical protein
MGPRLLAVAAWLATAVLWSVPAFAQPADDEEKDEATDAQTDGGVPPGLERSEVTDLTYTMRDDTFNTITIDDDDPRVAFVGTYQGRIYKTTDAGRTWTESTVVPEQRPLWAVPGGGTFLGGVRGDGGTTATPFLEISGDFHAHPINFPYVPAQLGRFVGPSEPFDPLADESAEAAGGIAGQLGVGLSARAPRLQLLVATRGRPPPGTNLARFLATGVLRGTTVTDISIDPTDKRLLYATTINGLYKSENGGVSWARTFAGLTSSERLALRVAIRPAGPPKLMVLGTLNGAYLSTDGDNWTKNGTVGGAVNDAVFDMDDTKYIYLATNNGVMRSVNGGQTFDRIYYSTFPAENDVKVMILDPFNPETLYIGTDRGAYVTHKARTASIADWSLLDGVQGVEQVFFLQACTKHRGHIYAAVTVKLHTINYGADPPESAVIESFDGGRTWRQLFTGQSDGQVETFALDPKDPDQLWVAWTTALHKLERKALNATASSEEFERPDGPTVSELVLAALRHYGLDLDEYTEHMQRSLLTMLLPKKVTLSGVYRNWSHGGVQDDAQFAANRYLQIADASEWEIVAWASWDLPERLYSAERQPMLRVRIPHVNDELRRQITNTVRRAYNELMRIRATLASQELDLKTRVFYLLRAEQLEAVIDVASGGYLERWQKKSRRKQK